MDFSGVLAVVKGFNNPMTPKGMSTLNPTPPWHNSPDFLSSEFWADSARYQYRELFILLDALFEGRPAAAALARDWSQGYPKTARLNFPDELSGVTRCRCGKACVHLWQARRHRYKGRPVSKPARQLQERSDDGKESG
jgi:hypothetical protein